MKFSSMEELEENGYEGYSREDNENISRWFWGFPDLPLSLDTETMRLTNRGFWVADVKKR